MIVWINGISGAGKSSLAKTVVEIIRESGESVVLLDGDDVRRALGNDLDHDVASRREATKRIYGLCSLLDSQGLHAVCPIIGNFPEIKDQCRNTFTQFCEVYIQIEVEKVRSIDSKSLYSNFDKGRLKNVVGMDIEFFEPTSPEFHIRNDGLLNDLLGHANPIAQFVLSRSR